MQKFNTLINERLPSEGGSCLYYKDILLRISKNKNN